MSETYYGVSGTYLKGLEAENERLRGLVRDVRDLADLPASERVPFQALIRIRERIRAELA